MTSIVSSLINVPMTEGAAKVAPLPEGKEDRPAQGVAYTKPVLRPGVMTGSQVRGAFGVTRFSWPGYLVLGHLNMIVGPQNVGKTRYGTTLAATLAGALRFWPDGYSRVGSTRVLLIDTEGMRGEIFAMLEQLGVPDGQVVIPTVNDDPFWIPVFPKDAPVVERLAVEHECGAILVDSLSGGHGLDENSAEMRKVLRAFLDIVTRLQCLMILVHHVNKKREFDSIKVTLDRVRGSSVISQFCRSVTALYRLDESDLTAPTRVETIKYNFGKPKPAFGFTIDDKGLLHFCDAPEPEKPLTATGRAVEFLEAELRQKPQKYSELLQKAEEQGIGKWSLYKGKEALHIQVVNGLWGLLAEDQNSGNNNFQETAE